MSLLTLRWIQKKTRLDEGIGRFTPPSSFISDEASLVLNYQQNLNLQFFKNLKFHIIDLQLYFFRKFAVKTEH